MFDANTWQEVYQTIRKSKLRTSLTALSVAWGIFMLVILLGAGNGLQNGIEQDFRDDAINSLWIYRGSTSIPHRGLPVDRRIEFTNEDYESIRDQVEGVDLISSRFYVPGEYTVSYRNKVASFDVRSCHPDHRYIENTMMVSGRFLNRRDLAQRRKVAVIGTKVVEQLFGRTPPLGKSIKISGIQYTVVGVFEDEGGEAELRMIYVPISTAQLAHNGGNRVHQMMLTVGDLGVEGSARVAADLRRLLASRHKFSVKDKAAVRVRNNLESYQRVVDIFEWINTFIWIVGAGTIVAGIVGVSNIMLISVAERTREIGVRKALGATPGSIIALVLQEAILITGVSGYLGLVAGVGLLEAVSALMPENDYLRDPAVDLRVALLATALLIVSGAVAGLFPARRAARVSPVEALRAE